MQVTHGDREVEFHDLIGEAHYILLDLGGIPAKHDHLDFQSMSCEMIAAKLGQELAQKYNRNVEVVVSEDGEAGARVMSLPQ